MLPESLYHIQPRCSETLRLAIRLVLKGVARRRNEKMACAHLVIQHLQQFCKEGNTFIQQQAATLLHNVADVRKHPQEKALQKDGGANLITEALVIAPIPHKEFITLGDALPKILAHFLEAELCVLLLRKSHWGRTIPRNVLITSLHTTSRLGKTLLLTLTLSCSELLNVLTEPFALTRTVVLYGVANVFVVRGGGQFLGKF